MRKKRFAVFSTGWSGQIVAKYLEGMQEALKDKSADVFYFCSYPPTTSYEELCTSELNIFNLPDLKTFDGLIVFSSSINYPETLNTLLKRCVESGVPTITRGVPYKGAINANIDNTTGMAALCNHIIKDHGVRRPAFIAGHSNSDDSNIRRDTFYKVLEENGLEFNDEYICYTDWDNFIAIDFIKSLKEKEKDIPFPDAFVCANDGLAMATVMQLIELGYKVPEDIIVTGFDFISDAQCFYPGIATVNQEFEELGRQSANILWNISEGIPFEGDEFSIKSSFEPGESCGCAHAQNYIKIRQDACIRMFSSRMDDNGIDRSLNAFEHAIVEAGNTKELSATINELVFKRNLFKSDTLHILLTPALFSSLSDEPISRYGYSENMLPIFSMEGGKLNDVAYCSRKELIPCYNRESDTGNHLYLFLPLYGDSLALGYVVSRDCLDMIDKRIPLKYQSRLSLSLQKYRQNINMTMINGQLVQMMKKDSLTNVKNRVAYEEALEALQKQITQRPAYRFAIVMCDINNLKKINDELGHEAGDEYIVSSSRLLCSIFSHSSIYRIGGDEFIVVLTNRDYERRNQLVDSMNEVMESMAASPSMAPQKKVSVALGIAEYDPEIDHHVIDVFKRADKLMYARKLEMKGNVR